MEDSHISTTIIALLRASDILHTHICPVPTPHL